MFPTCLSYRHNIARLPRVIPHLNVRHASTKPVKLSRSRWNYLTCGQRAYANYLSQALAAMNKALPVGKRIAIHDREQRKLIDERWRALTPEERAAFDDSNAQKYVATERSLADHEREDMAILEDVAKEMSEYLDQLQGVKNLSLNGFRSFSWLRQDHRDRIMKHSWALGIYETLSKEIVSLMTAELDHKRSRMTYKNFDQVITRLYGVTIENWPPVRFAAPRRRTSFGDMVGFYLLWKSGATRFRRLSAQEKSEWDATRLKLYAEHKQPLPSGRSPPTSLVPSSERPAHRLLIDTKAIGTIDQIVAFMDPVLTPKGRRGPGARAFRYSKAATQESGSS
ncbi:hypothetical protein BC629DRAFT_1600309 [Irpex lacteus]|nr:hypothetical protein BC629DRAFT_1600309 [Irpex lacteus]